MLKLKKEWELLLTALGFFTRIPIPHNIAFSQENLNRCNRYLPIIGLIVGGIGAGVFYGASFIVPHSVAVLVSMGATILATGAFHEDGFADVCDAFGGGWTKEKILIIMKDSRLGAYGAIGILMLLLVKFQTLNVLSSWQVIAALITAHMISRTMAAWTMYSLEYVREDETSKSKPIAKALRPKDLILAISVALLPGFLFHDVFVFLIIIPAFMAKWLLERYFFKWIGGYTGDCLGTIQQVTEVVCYLFLSAYFKLSAVSGSPFEEWINSF
ncbi:MAG: adenosylcobinamide-GDP ribazoletransferase [Marinilabiliaceae bacterium]|nr:adenosylcobinamide-GDP ribazoletransferase [Marinilabiliaceae bacterium]